MPETYFVCHFHCLGPHDTTCGAANSYGEIDLTPLKRDSSEINTAPRTALIEEVEIEPAGEESPATDAPAAEAPAADAPAE
jgi:hypothetical protein